jgi:L(+)-tartrate dehydratase beta subunit
MLETVQLALPAASEDLRKLEIGTVAYLSGRIFTAREGAYKRAIEEGAGMPAERDALGLANFHCSPAAAVNPDGSYTVGAVTATASFRFAQWLDGWFAKIAPGLAKLYAGTKPATLRRYGETDDKTDEVI